MNGIRLNPWCFLIVASILMLGSAGSVRADERTEEHLLARMNERLPELVELKLSEKVGETSRGLLEGRTTLERDARRLVSEENRDRLAYYNLLASRLGVPLAKVQEKRAEQIRKDSPDGIWLQSPDGSDWFRK